MTVSPAFVNLASSVTFQENAINAPAPRELPAIAAPQLIDADASLQFLENGASASFALAWDIGLEAAGWWKLSITGLAAGDVLSSPAFITDYFGFGDDQILLGTGVSLSVTRLTGATRGYEFKWTRDPGLDIPSELIAQHMTYVLQHLRFTNPDDTPTTQRVLTFGYSDVSGRYAASQQMTVHVTPQNDAPTITPDPVPVPLAPGVYGVTEGDAFALKITVQDPEGQAFTTQLAGEDAGLFTWNAATGVLTLNAPRDVETQTSADGDQDYEVQFAAIDSGSAQRQFDLTIRLQDRDEGMTLTGLGPVAAFAEGTVNAGPVKLDADVTFTRGDAPHQLIITGLLPEDRVSFATPAPGIVLDPFGVLIWQGVDVATVSGGIGTPLVVTFLDGPAAASSVEAVIESLSYASTSDAPPASHTLHLDLIDVNGEHLNHPVQPSFLRLNGAPNPFDGVDVGDNSAPVLTTLISPDGSNDGLPDLLVGRSDGLLRVSQNLGGGEFSSPSLFVPVTGPVNGTAIDVGTFSAPVAVDLDGDGRQELVVGAADGTLRAFRFDAAQRAYVEQTGNANPFGNLSYTGSAPSSDPANPFLPLAASRQAIDVGANAKPTFIDLDRDGLLDLVVGADDGALHAWKNYGTQYRLPMTNGYLNGFSTPGAVQFLPFAVNPFAGIDVGNDAAPAFSDLDLDGLPDLVIGKRTGYLDVWHNTGSGWDRFATDPFLGNYLGTSTTPTFGDIDGDGYDDLVVGNAQGTFTAFRNTAGAGQAILITITPENDAPTITSPAAVKYVETRTGPAYRIEATDLDGPGALIFSISGPDSGLFNINGSTGEISFKGAPNFESPLDTNFDNVYVLSVTAKDSLNAASSKALTITVTDVPEVPALTGLRPFLSVTEGQGPVLLDGDVTFKQGQPLSGAVLTVSGLVAGDVVGLQNNALINYNAAASLLNYNGQLISGVITGGNGNTFSVTFIDNASEAAVDAVIQALTFTTVSNSPAATRTLTINLTQAGGLSFAPAGAARHWEEVSADVNPLPLFGFPGLNFTPQVANLINDTRADLLIGTGQGDLLAFTGQVDPTQPSGTRYDGASAAFFQGIALPPGATDVAAARGDVNGDDIVDMVVGSSAGLQVFLGQADGSFALAPPSVVSPLIASDYAGAVPVLRNIDGDSAREIIVSPGGPGAYRFDALDFSGGAFVQKSTVYYAVDAGSLPTPFTDSADPGVAFLDVTGDGVFDIIAGTEAGTLRTWQGTTGAGAFGTADTLAFFTELTGSANPFAGIDVGSRARPTLSDVDGDGFTDLVVGDADGGLHWIRSTAALPQITVQVAPTNDAPSPPFGTTVFLPGFQTDAAGIITKAQLLQGWSDPEGDALQVFSVVASRGTLQDLGDGTWRYLSPLHATGTVTLSYVVSDGKLLTDGAASFGLGTLFAGQVKNGTAGADPLAGTVGNDTLRGKGGADSLEGGLGNDRLNGGGKADSLSGGNGADTLGGGSGDDSLAGGDGMDRLDGSDGNDRLTGGADADIFTVGAGADVVTDFEAGLDRLKVSGFLKYKDVQAAMADTADGVLLTMTGGTVLLEGLAIADLSKGDFILA